MTTILILAALFGLVCLILGVRWDDVYGAMLGVIILGIVGGIILANTMVIPPQPY